MTITNGQLANATEVLAMSGCPDAQNVNRILKADTSVFTNELYSGADDFTAAAGVKSTVDTSASTALYRGTTHYMLNFVDEASGDTLHDPDSFTNPTNPFDSDDNTYAEKLKSAAGKSLFTDLGKTFDSKFVGTVKVKAILTITGGANYSNTIKLETYNGSIWSVVATLASSSTTSVTYDDYYTLDATCQGVRISMNTDNSNASVIYHTHRLYTLEYGDYDAASTVETNSILNDSIVPKSIVVYGEKTVPANTSITIDVSDDGGTTFGVTGGAFNTPIDTTALSGSNIALKFNLATTDTEATPLLYGYGVVITNS